MAKINPQRATLGVKLREMREAANVQRGTVDKELGWHEGKTSRVERGDRVPVKAEITQLADLYKISDGDRGSLHLLADAARKREPSPRVADFSQTYMTFERQAKRIRTWDEGLIHGLLQTEDYARAVLQTRHLPDLDDILAGRIARRSILQSGVLFQAVIGEAALGRMVGGEQVRRAQLAHLLTLTASLSNVQVRVLPNSAGAHIAMGVGFTLLQMDGLRRVYIEGLTGATYIHEPDELEVYEEGFDVLWAAAANDSESATILRKRIDYLTEE